MSTVEPRTNPRQTGLRPITVTIKAARAISGLGNTKIWQLIKDGRLTVVRVDRRTLVTMDSLENLLSEEA